METFLPRETFILLTVFVINTAMALFIYVRGREYKANVWYAVFLGIIASWSLLLGLFYYAESDYPLLIITRLCYFVAVFIAPFFYFFSVFFTSEEKKLSKKTKIAVMLPAFLLTVLVLFGNLIIDYVGYKNEVKTAFLYKQGYVLYVLYFIILITFAYLELLKKYKNAEPPQKDKLLIIILGTALPFSGGMIASLILPMFTFQYMWLGPVFSIITAVVFVYAITKHHLLEIKAISAEILTFLILLVLFVKIFFAANAAQRLLDIGIFGAVLIFSAFLIKSVLNEVKQKEQERQINEHLQRINEELRELDAAKSEFISIAAHQLRTPLTVSKGYVSMILGGDYGKIGEEEKSALSKVFLSNERLIRLVNDFLDVSKIETGKLQFDFKKTDIVSLISSVVEELASAAADSSLYLKFEKPKERIPEIVADELKIRQVVMNLIDNAVKYTQTGGITVSLESLAGAPRFVKIKIADTGVGLEKNEIERLFTKFTRTEAGKKAHAGGAGIGLYIAKVITEKHGGKIWAESEGKGKGSAFFITLSVWPE